MGRTWGELVRRELFEPLGAPGEVFALLLGYANTAEAQP